MNEDLTTDDQTLILLTQRIDPDRDEPEPISTERLGIIERLLRESGRSISHLQTVEGRQMIGTMEDGLRLQALLDRAFRLGLKVQQWTEQNIEIVCRTGPVYPARLADRMGVSAPPVLYCMGEPKLLENIQTTILMPETNHDLSKYAERMGSTLRKIQ